MTREAAAAPDTGRLRWFWLLPTIAIAAWWPFAPYWQSDDFLALHYAQDLSRALHDCVGPQYGATDIWWFYRPLITLSFWLDQQLGGATPGVSFWSNVLAHATSTLLVGLIWRRFLGDRAAFAAAAAWAVLPSHLGSIAWAVGRVDSHTTVWCLATVWLCQRRGERGRGALAIAATTALALGSKELALVLPALATLVVWLQGRGNLRQRARLALGAAAPAWVALCAYLPLRLLALGRFGGYEAASYEPLAMLRGLGLAAVHLLVPLTWVGADGLPSGPAWLWLAAATTPVVIALLLAWRRRGAGFVLAIAAVFVVATAPMASILAAIDNPHTLRNYYLPALALTGLLAAAGRVATITVLLAWAWPFVAARQEQHAADRQSAAMHQALLELDAKAPPGPLFVAGLPHTSPHGLTVQLHYFVDRLLRPPFADSTRALYALRPLADSPAVSRLWPPGAPAFAPRPGATFDFLAPATLCAVPATAPLPELVVTGDDHGVFDFSTTRLEALEQGLSTTLTTPGVRGPWYRCTVFTACGYLASVCPDHADAGPDGQIDSLRLLAGPRKAFYAPGAFLGDGLTVPATTDLDTDFPLLLEAGTVDAATATFTPTHRATRLLRMRLDRGYPAWVRRVQGR